MISLKEIQRNLAVRNFRKKSKDIAFPHWGIGFTKAKNIGIMINVTVSNPKDLIMVTEFIGRLEEQGKRVVVIELNFAKKAEPMFNETTKSIFVGRKQVNWLGLPAREILKEINAQKLELLLDFDTTDSLTARFICGFSNASTRVGLYDDEFWTNYDLTINTPRTIKLKSLIAGYEQYLKMVEQ